jgi:DNA (cytosine-5)-methyltransferase 1
VILHPLSEKRRGVRVASRPLLLDLFCGAGGAAMGYYRAGFDVIGVDLHPQPRYPFPFYQGDALRFWDALDGASGNIAAVHASPPCQRFSTATKRNRTELDHPDLIAPIRRILRQLGLPYVIENVPTAPLLDPVLACGTSLNLHYDGFRLRRHRAFESNVDLSGVFLACSCEFSTLPVLDVTGGGDTRKPRIDGGGGRPRKGNAAQARAIMGIEWATKRELNEAIPPAYTTPIGKQLQKHVGKGERPA